MTYHRQFLIQVKEEKVCHEWQPVRNCTNWEIGYINNFKANVPVRNERIIIHCNWKNSMFDYLCDSTVYLVLCSDIIEESSCFFLVLHTMVKISLSDY